MADEGSAQTPRARCHSLAFARRARPLLECGRRDAYHPEPDEDSRVKTLQRTWAVVLAAGDGTRLSRLTIDEHGNAVPKQFCSLDGGQSLLAEAMQRARHAAPRERTCAIVADHHRRYWHSALWAVPRVNVIVQPRNCGTANGILLATLKFLERDPLALIVFLPADHFVRG